MSPILVISIIIGLVIFLLLTGYPLKLTRLLMRSFVKFGIGILILFFINVFGGMIGLHIPINIFTVIVTGFLGVFGATSIAAIHIFIL
ncbi:MAG TPA: pro-sigmaK processing inhibitor BofA family protein [Bacillota bacterium]|nr:pro-sigmaK processing inhibitor BofA family protein [Bacillota bacterium]